MVAESDLETVDGVRMRVRILVLLKELCVWAWTWLLDKGSEMLGAAFSMALTVGTIFRQDIPLSDTVVAYILAALASLTAICSMISLSKKEKMSSLKKQLRDAELSTEDISYAIEERWAVLKAKCRELLKGLAGQLKFENSDRITIYLYDEKEKLFRPVARVSSNPQIEELGHAIYSCEKGCLGKAWEDGHAKCSAPQNASTGSGVVKEEEWVKWCCGKFKFTDEEARKIKFKALEYFGWRVQHGHFEKKLAILMLESSQRKRWNTEELLSLLSSDTNRWSDLLEHVNWFSNQLPDREVAKKRRM